MDMEQLNLRRLLQGRPSKSKPNCIFPLLERSVPVLQVEWCFDQERGYTYRKRQIEDHGNSIRERHLIFCLLIEAFSYGSTYLQMQQASHPPYARKQLAHYKLFLSWVSG